MLDLVKEAVSYAKSQKGFNRILKEILARYKSLGRFSGFIVLINIGEEESKILGAIDYKLFGKKEGKLSIKKFIDYFKQGKFEKLCFEDFMKEYFKNELTTYKEDKEREEAVRKNFFVVLIEESKEHELGTAWLQAVIESKGHGYAAIIKEYEENKQELRVKLYLVMKALTHINFDNEKLEPLPLFSSRLTKDPHYFDIGTAAFRLLMYGICFYLEESYPQNIEEINEILYSSGIARDEISIFTTIYGIRAITETDKHYGWQGFYDSGEPLHISIKNLNAVSRLMSGHKVYVFENPIVFMEVIRGLQDSHLTIKPALVCTSGQLNTASLMLLDKLYKQGAELYYSGDFDPEGIRIADKLKDRYKDKLVLWRYSVEDYLNIKGTKGFEGRENKLEKVKSKELLEVRNVMEKEKACGYQELLIEEYVEDIINTEIR